MLAVLQESELLILQNHPLTISSRYGTRTHLGET